MAQIKTLRLEILTPQSPRWSVFRDSLASVMASGFPAGQWHCDGDREQAGGNVYRYARQVMQDMRRVDVTGTLEFLEGHGCHCDCEILLNEEDPYT